jgi:uncharacterized protein YndB with AHSA1/START domain
MMEKLTFETEIAAPALQVYETMIADASYRKWTYAFNPTSHYKGSWNKGEKILFIGTDENGKAGGMVSHIRENIPGEYISIEHRGLLDGENEITSGPMVEGWAGSLENYTFTESAGITTVTVEMDANEDFKSYFETTWPKALEILKQLCEQA